jgi:hypothetical protein
LSSRNQKKFEETGKEAVEKFLQNSQGLERNDASHCIQAILNNKIQKKELLLDLKKDLH